MADPALLPLLELQRHDQRVADIEKALAEVPLRRSTLETALKNSRERLASLRHSLQQKEVKRKALDTELLTLDARVVQLKAQEVMARKKEAFEALGHEIEAARQRGAAIEDEELVLLDELERESAAVAAATKVQAGEEAELNAKTAALTAEETRLRADLVTARADTVNARGVASPAYLTAYDAVRKIGRRFPIIVPIVKHVCQGCHLKVSQESWEKALHPGNLARCDQCGRLVWGEQ